MKALIFFITYFSLSCAADPFRELSSKPTNLKPLESVKYSGKCSKSTQMVAVIDTGFNFDSNFMNNNLCKFGHKDFTSIQQGVKPYGYKDFVPSDSIGHGANVVGLINQYAKNSNYCIVVLKYYDRSDTATDPLSNTINAIRYATSLGVKYINYSGGGTDPSYLEKLAIKNFLDQGGKFVAAAGNERKNVDQSGYYPALDDSRITVVGSAEKDGTVSTYSNWGSSVKRWEYGSNAVGFGIKMSGTSQATAIATGKIINESECDK